MTKLLKHYPDQSRKLWQNQADDWSTEICYEATIEDLDLKAIAVARKVFADKNKRLADDPQGWG